MSAAIPSSFRSYFWDVPFDSIDIHNDAHFIIKRLLDRGTTQHIRWVLGTYGKDEIKKVLVGTRDLDRATGNFWADILDVNKKEVLCLRKPYFPIHFGLSS